MANAAYRKLVGDRDIIGKTVSEALPEVVSQGFLDLLERVRSSGEPFIGRGVGVQLEAESGGLLEERFLDFIYQPISNGAGEAAGVFVQGHDVTDQHRAQSALRESEERFRLVANSAPVMLWMSDAAGNCLYLNDAQGAFWGVAPEEIPTFDWGDTVHPEDRQRVHEEAQSAMAERRSFTLEGRYRRADGEYRLMQTSARPRLSSSGEFLGMIGVNLDLTETRRAQEHQQLLIHELNHRVKNTLSIVQALAMQSFNERFDPAVARKTFDARLTALSAAHSLLTTQNWESAGLLETIKASVAATVGANVARVALRGPDIVIAPQTAVSLAMTIHELCTNAIKYGALSNDNGKVDVRWNAAPGEGELVELSIDWTEAGGPPVETPSRRGFGTRLIERGLSAELRSTVQLDFQPAGLKCTILAKLPAVAK
jgi:PAS domain S-box-containing protein